MDAPFIKSPPGLRYRAFLRIYAAALWLLEPLAWRYFSRRAKGDPAYLEQPEERRGEGAPFDADIWVHAVSLGEFTSAEPLIRLALADGQRVVITHATPAGRRASERALAAEIASGQVAIRYMPIDRPKYWRRFHRAYSPRAGLVMEVEFWPVMLEEARRAGCALCLANSQVPSKSFPRAARLSRLAGHPVTQAAGVFAKSEHIATRFRALGANPVIAMGETRFDIPPPARLIEAGQNVGPGRPVLTLASVVAGEEELYIRAIAELLAGPENPLVIWVPRAPEKFEAHAEYLAAKGFRVLRRTEAFDDDLRPVADLSNTQILVGNSLGEMFFYLAPADAVIVGGGFIEKGAHNVIEPLSLGKPVITGPHVWTIEYPAVEAEAAGVLSVVREEKNLVAAIREAMGGGADRAEAFHAANQGASARIYAAILPLLEASQ